MSEQERSQYMKNVRWTTFWYAAFTAISLVITGTLGVASIRGDIKTLAITEQSHYVSTNHKIDSLQHDNNIEFKDIWKAIRANDSIKQAIRVVYKNRPRSNSYVTERWINGKLVLIPVK